MLPSRPRVVEPQPSDELEGTVTVSFLEPVPFRVAATLVAREAGVSIVLPDNVGGLVVMDLGEVPVMVAFRELARAVDLEPRVENRVVRFVPDDLRPGAVLRLNPGTSDEQQVKQVIEAAVPEVEVFESVGGLVAVGEVDQLKAAEQVVEALQSGRDIWRIDVRVVQVDASVAERYGLGLSTGGVLDADVAAGEGGAFVAEFGARISARAVLEALATDSSADVVNVATLTVVEGRDARVRQGSRVPVPRRVVSDQGTVTTVGFDEVETGFLLDVGVRRVGDAVLLRVRPELSSVTGFVDERPLVATSSLESEVVADEGRWVLVSGLRSATSRTGGTGLPGFASVPVGAVQTREASEGVVVVGLRAVRAWAPADAPVPVEQPPQAAEGRAG